MKIGQVTISGSTASVLLSCPSQPASPCHATLTLKTTNHADTLHTVTVGQASATIAAGQTKTVTVELNSTGQQLLKKRGRLQTTLTIAQSATPIAHKILTFH